MSGVAFDVQLVKQDEAMDATTKTKPFNIDKKLVYDAYKVVKTNAGAAGVDGQSLEMFEKDLMKNLYKIWNRMSSGSESVQNFV